VNAALVKICLLAGLYHLSLPAALAQEDMREAERRAEIERQETFRAGFQDIVTDLNGNSLERFANAIDRDDMLERIFGLRLIDQKVKQGFRERFENNLVNILESAFAGTQGNIRAAWLGFGSKGDRGKAIVRYDLPDFQFSYHEYELRLDDNGRVVILDWIDYLRGEKFSDAVGNQLVAANPGKPAVRKLLDFQGPTEQQVFKMTELLKASRDRQVDRYFEILGGMNDQLRSQRIVVVTSVHLCKATGNRRKLREALIDVDRYFPEEPLYSLMLLDYYFPSRKYEEAMQALLRLQSRLGVQDSAMAARLSAASLVLGNAEEALGHADRAVTIEPGLELGWWSALRARTAMQQYDRAVEALDELDRTFGYTLGPEAFETDPSMSDLLLSDDYEAWYDSRRQPEAGQADEDETD
jgi:tetratricopeptide (TPR) repeat protein